MTATNNHIRRGDIVIYTGSITDLNGPAVYAGYCHCGDCDGLYREDRYVLIAGDAEVLECVRRTSFTAEGAPTCVPDALSGMAYAIREDQRRLDTHSY